MKKLISILCVLCILFSAVGCTGQHASSSAVSQSKSMASPSLSIPEEKPLVTLSPFDGHTVTFLYDDIYDLTDFSGPSADEVVRLSQVYIHNRQLYYIDYDGTTYRINKKDLETGENEVLYKTTTEEIYDFLVMDNDEIIIRFSRGLLPDVGDAVRILSELYYYNRSDDSIILFQDKFGIDTPDSYIPVWCLNEVLYIRSGLILYRIQNGQVEHLKDEYIGLRYDSGNIYDRYNKDGATILRMANLTDPNPVDILSIKSEIGHVEIYIFGKYLRMFEIVDNAYVAKSIDLETKTIVDEVVLTPPDGIDGHDMLFYHYPDRSEYLKVGTGVPLGEPPERPLVYNYQLYCYDVDGNMTTYPPFVSLQLRDGEGNRFYAVDPETNIVYYLTGATGDEDRLFPTWLELASLEAEA